MDGPITTPPAPTGPEGWVPLDVPPLPPAPPSPAGRYLLFGCLGLSALGLATLVVFWIWIWPEFTVYGVTSDLTEYEGKIAATSLPDDRKAAYEARLEKIREAVRRKGFGFLRWVGHDEVIVLLFEDGNLTEAEERKFDAELRAIEDQLR